MHTASQKYKSLLDHDLFAVSVIQCPQVAKETQDVPWSAYTCIDAHTL